MYNNVTINVSGPVQPSSIYKTIVLKGNIPFVSQVTKPNMKYVIKHDFDLGGENVTIPENCILEFDGGILSNGIVVLNGCAVLPSYDTFNDGGITISGMPKVGTMKWDIHGNKPLWSNGTNWVDATGIPI